MVIALLASTVNKRYFITMKAKRLKASSLIKKTIGFFLLLFYFITTITSCFPAFHNHNHQAHSCNCSHEDSWGFEERRLSSSYSPSHNHSVDYCQDESSSFEEYSHCGEAAIELIDLHQEDLMCMACKWQTLVQLHTVFISHPRIFSELVSIDKTLPDDRLNCKDLMCNLAIRAPPLS